MKKKGIVDFLKATMRITISQIILAAVLTCATLAAHVEAQILDQRVSLSVDDGEIRHILRLIQKQIPVKFVYSPAAIQAKRKATVHVSDKKFGRNFKRNFNTTSDQFRGKEQSNFAVQGKAIHTLNEQEKQVQTSFGSWKMYRQQNIRGNVTDESGKECRE